MLRRVDELLWEKGNRGIKYKGSSNDTETVMMTFEDELARGIVEKGALDAAITLVLAKVEPLLGDYR